MEKLTLDQVKSLVKDEIQDLYEESNEMKELEEITTFDSLLAFLDGLGFNHPEVILLDMIIKK